MERVIALMSGGIDSFLMAVILKKAYDIIPLYINYEHLAYQQEIMALKKQINYLDLPKPIEIKIAGLSSIIQNSLTNESELINDFYPGRNLLFLVVAAQIAKANNVSRIAIGIIKSIRVFPDANNEFLINAEKIISETTDNNVIIHAPILDFLKFDVLSMFTNYRLPFELTYSCQKKGPNPCGICPSCIDIKNVEKEQK